MFCDSFFILYISVLSVFLAKVTIAKRKATTGVCLKYANLRA